MNCCHLLQPLFCLKSVTFPLFFLKFLEFQSLLLVCYIFAIKMSRADLSVLWRRVPGLVSPLCFYASQVGQGVPQWREQRSWCPGWVPLLCPVCCHVSTPTPSHLSGLKPFLRNWDWPGIQLLCPVELMGMLPVHLKCLLLDCFKSFVAVRMYIWTVATWFSFELHVAWNESLC